MQWAQRKGSVQRIETTCVFQAEQCVRQRIKLTRLLQSWQDTSQSPEDSSSWAGSIAVIKRPSPHFCLPEFNTPAEGLESTFRPQAVRDSGVLEATAYTGSMAIQRVGGLRRGGWVGGGQVDSPRTPEGGRARAASPGPQFLSRALNTGHQAVGSPAHSMAGMEGHGGSVWVWAPPLHGGRQAQGVPSGALSGLFRQPPEA